MGESSVIVQKEVLKQFVTQVFSSLQVPLEEAKEAAESLVNTAVRGIDSHGVPRLHYYVNRLKKGLIKPRCEIRVVRETDSSLLVDGGNCLGQLASKRTMELCIDRARENGACTASVFNSNHFGAAGYYAMMALPHDLIGISMTNGYPLQPPTFGIEPMIGANPLAVAIPSMEQPPFVLDMSTSTVAFGKLEIANREGKPIPLGWALDKTGKPTTDPQAGMEGRTLLPLGGTRELGSHKGYGLGVMVDVLCSVLSGAAFGRIYVDQGREVPANIGHFFAAISTEAFGSAEKLKERMDDMLLALKSSSVKAGEQRIYTAGEIEYLYEVERSRDGIPLNGKVAEDLRDIGIQTNVACPF